jgi:hypothetical protein
VVLAVHDELVVECNISDAEGVAACATACLEEGGWVYITEVPIRVDTSVIAEGWAG